MDRVRRQRAREYQCRHPTNQPKVWVILTAETNRPGQMTEETHNAAVAGSVGIIMAIGVSAVLGLFLLLGLLFSIQDLDRTVGSPTGQPVAQIFLDTVGEKGAIVLMVRDGVTSNYCWGRTRTRR